MAAQLPLEVPPSSAGTASGPAAELAQLADQLRQSQEALDQYRSGLATSASAVIERLRPSDPQAEAKLSVARRRLSALE
ncbi:MAG: hypothetical protein ACK559_28970, partial [bacterium]